MENIEIMIAVHVFGGIGSINWKLDTHFYSPHN